MQLLQKRSYDRPTVTQREADGCQGVNYVLLKIPHVARGWVERIFEESSSGASQIPAGSRNGFQRCTENSFRLHSQVNAMEWGRLSTPLLELSVPID